MEITNKTLGMLLIAAIVVSLGGTFVSLNELGGTSTTGYATNNETGQVLLNVGSSLSIIVTADNDIDFGTCNPQAGDLFLDSSVAAGVGDNTNCDGTFNDAITVQNDGNIDANVTLRTSRNGTNMFDTATGGLAYKIANGSAPGCEGVQVQTAYLNFTIENGTDPLYKYPGCSNLSFIDLADEMRMYAGIVLPPSTTAAYTAVIQFEAEPSLG